MKKKKERIGRRKGWKKERGNKIKIKKWKGWKKRMRRWRERN